MVPIPASPLAQSFYSIFEPLFVFNFVIKLLRNLRVINYTKFVFKKKIIENLIDELGLISGCVLPEKIINIYKNLIL